MSEKNRGGGRGGIMIIIFTRKKGCDFFLIRSKFRILKNITSVREVCNSRHNTDCRIVYIWDLLHRDFSLKVSFTLRYSYFDILRYECHFQQNKSYNRYSLKSRSTKKKKTLLNVSGPSVKRIFEDSRSSRAIEVQSSSCIDRKTSGQDRYESRSFSCSSRTVDFTWLSDCFRTYAHDNYKKKFFVVTNHRII